MRRLAVRALYLLIAFATLIGASRAYGEQQPASPSIRWLHLADCQLPCWAGIVLGQTASFEASKRIAEAYPDYDMQAGYSLGGGVILADGTPSYTEHRIALQNKSDPEQKFTIVLSTESGTQIVREIGFVTINKSLLPTIPELSAYYGAPTCAIQNQGRGNTPLMAIFSRDIMQVSARVLSRGYGWQQRVYELRISLNDEPSCRNWRGFTNLSRYLPR